MLGCCSFSPLDALITEEDSGFSVLSSRPHRLIFSLLIINTSGLRIYLEFSLNDFFSWAQDCGWDGEQVMWRPDPCVFLSCSSLYLMRHGRLIEPRAPWWARLQLALEMPCLCLLSGKSQLPCLTGFYVGSGNLDFSPVLHGKDFIHRVLSPAQWVHFWDWLWDSIVQYFLGPCILFSPRATHAF